MYDVIVVGGGVIGLSIAREIAVRKSVLLLDRGATGEGTSWAAAGMLAPLSEADEQNAMFQLCVASHRLYGKFARELKEESGIEIGYSDGGLLFLASTDESSTLLRTRY